MAASVSLRGWLDRAPDGRRRMTGKQKDLVVRAVHAAMDRADALAAEDTHDAEHMLEVVAEHRRCVVAAIEAYPSDRSCATCDLYSCGHCLEWGQDVPPGAVEAGCDRHQDDGAPF